MYLPPDYPRINQFPEWFTAEPDRSYPIRNVADETKETFSGKQLH